MENTQETAVNVYTIDNLTQERVDWARDKISKARWHAKDTKAAVERLRLFLQLANDETALDGQTLQTLLKMIRDAAPSIWALEEDFNDLDHVDDILLGYAHVEGIDD